jgi:hypothetical protein
MPRQKVYLQSIKNPSRRYLVLRYNPDTKTATLQGAHGGTFDVKPFTKEKVLKDGYTLVKDDDHAITTGVPQELPAGGKDSQGAGGTEGAHAETTSAPAGDEEGVSEAA